MPISTNINSAAALYALMTTVDQSGDLAQSYIQTANIDMSGYTSLSIAHNDGLNPRDFTGTYDGQGYTITIGDLDPTYTGLFDSVAANGIVRNVNVIYSNTINLSSVTVFGGLVGSLNVSTISNCSIRINGSLTLGLTANSYAGLLCGNLNQESSITNSSVTITSTISINGDNDSEIGLLCGLSEDSNISDCSVVGTAGTYDISLKANENTDSDIGLICGYCGAGILTLPPQALRNVTVTLNNTGSIILDSTSSTGAINKGAICGTLFGNPDSITMVNNCSVNITNNQTLTGTFADFFGQVTDDTIVTACQFNYTTTTNNTSRPLTISPVVSPAVLVIYINSFVTNTYSLASGGNYYIPNNTATILLGSQSITLVKDTASIIINGLSQQVGTTFSSSTTNYNYTVVVKGVGSMYFGFNYSYFDNGNIIDTPIECICQVNSCATNPQTGISADSRITNTREDKTIRVNADREFSTNAVIYPKFKSYSDYMKYLQAGLKY